MEGAPSVRFGLSEKTREEEGDVHGSVGQGHEASRFLEGVRRRCGRHGGGRACRLRAEHGHRHGRDRRQCQCDDPSGGQRCRHHRGARRVDAHPLPPELQPDVPEHGVCGGRRRGAPEDRRLPCRQLRLSPAARLPARALAAPAGVQRRPHQVPHEAQELAARWRRGRPRRAARQGRVGAHQLGRGADLRDRRAEARLRAVRPGRRHLQRLALGPRLRHVPGHWRRGVQHRVRVLRLLGLPNGSTGHVLPRRPPRPHDGAR